MQQRHSDRRLYFEELASTCKEFYINYLKKFKKIDSNLRVLEIGCGEGGNLMPFAQLGCYVEGMDLNKEKIQFGNEYFKELNYNGCLACKDFFIYPIEQEEDRKFDIIMIHDVVEHIPSQQKQEFLQRIKKFLKSDGIIFFGFPAWQMPFGGHQQICKHILAKIPFIHLLPNRLYVFLLHLTKEKKDIIDELLSIKEAKMPIEKFERLFRASDLQLVDRTFWFINPHYKQKFHLKPRKQNKIIACIPYIRNYFTTSCFYLLKTK